LLLPELWSDDKEAFMGVYFDGWFMDVSANSTWTYQMQIRQILCMLFIANFWSEPH
jgi:hypothetical protein